MIKMKWKILIDIFMSATLLLLMAYGLIGEAFHEWAGVTMFTLFLLHLFLNRKWFAFVGKGRYSPARVAQIVLIILSFLCLVGCMVSGILLSRYVFTFLPEQVGYMTARKLHMLCSYWGFVLMCLHLGTQWGMVLGVFRKKRKLPKGGAWLGYLIAVLGIPALLRRDVADYLFLRSHFVFFDYGEPVGFFLLDYLLITALFVAVGHEGIKLLRKRR